MDLARNWRLQGARYRLEGCRCDTCGTQHFPARMVCPTCRSRELSPVRFSGRGEVYSHTTLYQAPAGFTAPYVVALVQLAEGPLVTAQLTDVDPEAVYIGLPVEMVTRKLSEQGENGLIVYGYKFRPPVPESIDRQPALFAVKGQTAPTSVPGHPGQDGFVIRPMPEPVAMPVAN